MINHILHVMGVDNLSGRWYGFWSGIGADTAYFAAPAVLFRKHNCHVAWCWRIGHHPQEGYTVCHKHFRSGDNANVG